jgi:hypothetical protein
MWGLAYNRRKEKAEPERGNGVRALATELAPSAHPTSENTT